MKKTLCLFTVLVLCSPFLSAQQEGYTGARGIDGDTLKLANGQKMKLAGINAPELHDESRLRDESRKFGKDIWAYRTLGGNAAKETGRILAMGKNQIRLETGTEAFDGDADLIAYVFVPAARLEEGMVPDEEVFFKTQKGYEIFLNAYLVKMGFAEVVSAATDAGHQQLFLKLQAEAKATKRGIWAQAA